MTMSVTEPHVCGSEPHVVAIGEDERLFRIEADGDDVAGVLERHLMHLRQCEIFPNELLVIRQLNH